MGCNCGGKKSGINYEVKLQDGTILPTRFASVGEAQAAGGQSGQTYTFKAVPKR